MARKKAVAIYIEIAATLVFFAVFMIMYARISLNGICVGDEGFYYTIPYRLLQGDNLISDEWHLSQFSSVFTFLPMKAFLSLTGSTDGIILFFRIFYVVSLLLTGSFVLLSFNRFSQKQYACGKSRMIFFTCSLCAAALLFSYIPAAIPSLSYYSVSIMGLADLICLLFCYDKKSPVRNIAAGLVFAAMVFAQPGCVIPGFLFVVYTVAVTVIAAVFKKRKQKKLPSSITESIKPNFIMIAVSILSGLTVFILICVKTGIGEVFQAIPYLLNDPDHLLALGSDDSIGIQLYLEAFDMYGRSNLIVLLVLTVLSAVLYRYRNKTRPFLLPVYTFFLLLIYISIWKYVDANHSIQTAVTRHGLPLYISGPFFLLISPGINKKLLGMWLTCACFSAVYSFSSNIILFTGGIVAGMVSLLILGDMLIGLAHQNEKPAFRRAAIIAITVSVFVSAAFEGQYFIYQWKYPIIESEMSCAAPETIDTVIPSGPHKGIRTSARIARLYASLLEDMHTINNISKDGDHLLVASMGPWLYLASDLNASSYSAWYWTKNSSLQRLLTWWELHPAQCPDYIYFSVANMFTYENASLDRVFLEAVIDAYDLYCDFEPIKGKAGFILKITDTHIS